jgi:hypothetical protein
VINNHLLRGDHRPVQLKNRKGKTYYLHQGKTKTGTPQNFFSMKAEDGSAEAIPADYGIFENPNAQVFVRRQVLSLTASI